MPKQIKKEMENEGVSVMGGGQDERIMQKGVK